MKIFSVIGALCWIILAFEYDWTLILCWFIATLAASVWVFAYLSKKQSELQLQKIKKLDAMLSKLAADMDGISPEPEPVEIEHEDKTGRLYFGITATVLFIIFIAAIIYSYASEVLHALNHLR